MGKCPQQHMQLRDRLALVPKLVFIPYLFNHHISAEAYEYREDLLKIIDQKASDLNSIASTVTYGRRPQPRRARAITLSSHLQSVYAGISSYNRREKLHRLLNHELHSIRYAALSVRCDRCKKKRMHICDGTPERDSKTVAAGGECWRILHELFSAATAATEHTYAKHSRLYRKVNDVEVIFSTIADDSAKANGTPHAVTRLRDQHTQGGGIKCVSKIEVNIPTKTFGARTYFALPYIVYHEVLVHAVQSTLRRGVAELRSEYSECGFAEGSVDAVAYEVLQEHLQNIPKSLRNLHRFRARIEEVADELHQIRRNAALDPGTSSGAVASRERGYRVYDALKKEFGPEACRAAVLGINLLPYDRTERVLVLQTLFLLINDEHSMKNESARVAATARKELLKDSLRKFIRSGNHEQLLADVRKIGAWAVGAGKALTGA